MYLCNKQDCTNPATHLVGFKVWASNGAKAKNGPCIESHFSNFAVCADHAPKAVDDFMIDESRARINAAIAAIGKAKPKWSTAVVNLIPIDTAPDLGLPGPKRSGEDG